MGKLYSFIREARPDEALLEAIAHLHEAGRIFDAWSDRIRPRKQFWNSYSETIVRVSGGISDMECEVAYLLGAKIPDDLDSPQEDTSELISGV